jgi:hypothetical protein
MFFINAHVIKSPSIKPTSALTDARKVFVKLHSGDDDINNKCIKAVFEDRLTLLRFI